MSFDKVKEVIVDTINCEEEDVVLTTSLKEDLNLDSLDAVELSMALEEAFELSISEDDLASFVTVKDIVNYVDSHTNN
ncbi:MAG: acyl carrier protein [Lachnospiraceae bacterium]